ncbi:MAG: DUF1284 domain-containing protein [Simkaniaceae bacterium]|nr:DUF1284 domain-containing protein [Simkaniaceae bacterium]
MIRFRPHHFLCTYNFRGKGYSPSFITNYQQVIQRLEKEPIEIVNSSDSICAPCPHRRGGMCQSEARIRTLDRRHEEAFGFGKGPIFWKEARAKIEKHFSIALMRKTCDGCSWLKICEEINENA